MAEAGDGTGGSTADGSGGPTASDGLLRQLVEDLERYSDAGGRLAERLLHQQRWAIEDVERLRGGMSLVENMQHADSAERSRVLTRLMEEFEESRRAIRSSVVAALLEEGISMVDIGRKFGVSRQRANQLVKEARARHSGTPSDADTPETPEGPTAVD